MFVSVLLFFSLFVSVSVSFDVCVVGALFLFFTSPFGLMRVDRIAAAYQELTGKSFHSPAKASSASAAADAREASSFDDETTCGRLGAALVTGGTEAAGGTQRNSASVVSGPLTHPQDAWRSIQRGNSGNGGQVMGTDDGMIPLGGGGGATGGVVG